MVSATTSSDESLTDGDVLTHDDAAITRNVLQPRDADGGLALEAVQRGRHADRHCWKNLCIISTANLSVVQFLAKYYLESN